MTVERVGTNAWGDVKAPFHFVGVVVIIRLTSDGQTSGEDGARCVAVCLESPKAPYVKPMAQRS